MTTEGQKLKIARLKYNVRQKTLAEKMGCSQQNIYRLENGDSPIQHSTMVKLARALGVDMDAIWTQEEQDAAFTRQYGNLVDRIDKTFQAVSVGLDNMLLDLYHKLSVQSRKDLLIYAANLVDTEKVLNEKPNESETFKLKETLNIK